MKFTHSKVDLDPLYAFSVSFSKSYGLIGFDFGKHSIQIILWAKKR